MPGPGGNDGVSGEAEPDLPDRLHGRREGHGFSLKTGDRREAETIAGGVEKTLMRIEQTLLRVPTGVDIVAFVQNDGRGKEEAQQASEAEPITFARLRDRDLASNCAAKRVDQRLIDGWLGQTTETRRRYLHLILSDERNSLGEVFG